MSATGQFTDEQKAEYVTLAGAKGRAAAAKKAGVSTATISKWAAGLGVNLTEAQAAEAKKAPKKKRRARKSAQNGHANGKANGHTAVGMPASAQSLDTIQAHVTEALRGLTAMRAAFRQVFGG